LPKDSNGIQAVFSNPCTKSFSYQINGPTVEFLGVQDQHDVQYNNLGVQRTLHELGVFTKNNSLYSGAPLDDEHCPMTIHLYPSDEMKFSFTSNDPIIFTVAVIVIFAFVSLVFYGYDKMVQVRQESVMNTAVRSTAIVSSLFPSEVRDRLYQSSDTQPTKSDDNARGVLSSLLLDHHNSEMPKRDIMNSPPIAELYPETTVLFADIAGFTAWCSERNPTQVFILLETVYGAFDAIAKKLGVFKVETIGDCYVAVVGLPTPRKHHAVVMARFASQCRGAMKSIVEDLAKTLGPVSRCGRRMQLASAMDSKGCSCTTGNGGTCHSHWVELGSDHCRRTARGKVPISVVWRCKSYLLSILSTSVVCGVLSQHV
jgi:Adenylate and Guanylate cyclase catalytic domain